MQTETKPKSELDEWFDRDEDKKPERDWSSLWPRLNELYDAYVTPVGRERREYIHDLLEVKSTKDIPPEVDDNQIVKNLKAALDARHQLKSENAPKSNEKAANLNDSENAGNASNVSSIVQPALSVATHEPIQKGNDKTMQPESVLTPLPEAAFVVLFALYTPGGVEMKYTVRAATGEELDRQVEDYIKRKLAAGWTTQRPQLIQPPSQMQNAQTGGTAAPSAPPAQSNGNKPVLTERIVKIEREFDKDKKVHYTGLYTMIGSGPGKFATYKVSDSRADTIQQLLALTGKDWTAEPLGSEQSLNLTAHYTESDKKNASGKPYHDLVSVAA